MEAQPAFWRQPVAWLTDWTFGNPIIYRELIRSLRLGRYFVLMALILIVGSIILSTLWASVSTETAPVGRTLFYATVGGQLLVIILLLPGYVAQNLIVERDRNTFPLLLTTPLSPFRIIYGKLMSTLGVMLVLIISTYPLIGVCMARGGVSPYEVIFCAVGLLFASFVVASFAIYHALQATTPLRAILLTQFTLFLGYIIGAAVVTFIIGMLMAMVYVAAELANISSMDIQWLVRGMATLIALPLLSIIPVALLIFASKKIRFTEPRIRHSWEMSRSGPGFQFSQSVANAKERPLPQDSDGIPDHINPFYWRERKAQRAHLTPMSVPSWYIIAIVAYHLLLITPLEEGRWLAIVTLVFLAQMAPAHAASLFAGERENESWDLLITTISKGPRLIAGKLMGALRPCLVRWAALILTPVILIYALGFLFLVVVQRPVIPMVPPTYLVQYLLVMAVHILFLTTLTGYLSLRFKEVNRVLVWAYGIAATYYFAPLVLQLLGLRFGLVELEVMMRAFSPLTLVYDIVDPSPTAWLSRGLHVLAFGMAALFFYSLSVRSLDRMR